MRMELNWPMEPLMCLGVISPRYMGSTLRAIPMRRSKALRDGWSNSWVIVVHFFVVLGIQKMENQVRIVVLIVLDPLWQKSISESGQWSSPTPKQVSASQRLMRATAQGTGLEMISRVWISVSCPRVWPQRKVWQWRPELEENGDPVTSKQPSLSGRVGFQLNYPDYCELLMLKGDFMVMGYNSPGS